MNETRVQEIKNSFESFNKEAYFKNEALTEMFKLQDEMVKLTFNGEHASTAKLKLWDVERHFEQLNEECGNVADGELRKFKAECKAFSNKIRAEVSGSRGESKAFNAFNYLPDEDVILTNVELHDGNLRTELDAIVIAPEMITIVEVKNTGKNIFIDENGDYYKTGEFLGWDCNIAEKMSLRENMVRNILEPIGIADLQIRNVIVFTDNRIEVQNKYSRLKTCFVSQLSHIINSFYSDMRLSYTEIDKAASLIKSAEVKEAYGIKFDVDQFKNDFALLLTILEEASSEERVNQENKNDEKVSVNVVSEEPITYADSVKDFISSEIVKNIAKFSAGVAMTILTSSVLRVIRR